MPVGSPAITPVGSVAVTFPAVASTGFISLAVTLKLEVCTAVSGSSPCHAGAVVVPVEVSSAPAAPVADRPVPPLTTETGSDGAGTLPYHVDPAL